MNHSIEWYKVTNLRLKMVRFVKNQYNFAYCTLSKYADVTVIPSMSTRFVAGIHYTSVISSRFRLAFVAPFCHLETFSETQNCRTGSQAKPCSECSRPFSHGWFRSVFLSFSRPHTVGTTWHKHGTNMAQTWHKRNRFSNAFTTCRPKLTDESRSCNCWPVRGRVQRKGL